MYSDSSSPILTDSLFCGNYKFVTDVFVFGQIYGSYTDNGDNIVNDLCPPMEPISSYQGDLDGDGDVDYKDFAIMAENWLAGV
jgi:hypothetical protein